ncbi:hypothetical protein [Micromonospora mirobrigensis]|uniref:SAV-6107-like HEPN domain-containing protein n=1 Tax=Micromonospora mirobrigensis TaxID=262898 RepID=A0A1C4WU78_9ACTN|nr:hypothetical protein [Micromonospora mirobrigensis]SCE99431.1 hypothetical protein GA0070564_102492 [Micromonospora mirobrigensis]
MTAPTADRCLSAADRLLRGAGRFGAAAVTAGWWPRVCACLIRLALEGGVDGYWQRVRPDVAACQQNRAKQLMLRGRLGPGAAVARRIGYAWATLSTATHHHCYELAPTAAELRRLHTEVADLLTELAGRRASAP